jgi:hypothetical protein
LNERSTNFLNLEENMMKKYILMTTILASSLMPSLIEAKGNPQEGRVIFDASIKYGNPEALALKKVIENSFMVSTDMNATKADYARYHTKDYIQHVDGKVLNYDEYVAHREALKKTVKSAKIFFNDMIIEGNKVVTRHTAYVTKKDNKKIELQVIAIFEIKDGKIVKCDELTHLIKGERADRDIGSRE